MSPSAVTTGSGEAWYSLGDQYAKDWTSFANPGLSSSSYNLFEDWFNPKAADRRYNSEQAAIDRAYNSFEAERSRQFSSEEAEKAYQRNLEMSSTAYKRAVADMRDVGLNPYALYGSASPAASVASPVASATQAHSSGARAVGSASAVGAVLGLAGTALMAMVKMLAV